MKNCTLLGLTVALSIASFAPPAGAQERGRRYDRRFLDTMVQHHQETLDLASLGRTASNPDVKDLLRSIRRERRAELEELQSWREDWYGDAPVTLLPDMGPPPPLEELESMAPGGHRDLMILNLMVQHHEDGVRLAREALSEARHHPIRELAERLIDVQERELEQLRALQSSLGAEVRAFERHLRRRR